MLVPLMMLLPPPQPLASPPGHDRRDLLLNILQGRIQLLRGHAHHLLTQILASYRSHCSAMICSSFASLRRSPGRGDKIWGWDTVVYHTTKPSLIRHVCSPAYSPQSGSLRVWVRKSMKACTIWRGSSSTTSVGCLGPFGRICTASKPSQASDGTPYEHRT